MLWVGWGGRGVCKGGRRAVELDEGNVPALMSYSRFLWEQVRAGIYAVWAGIYAVWLRALAMPRPYEHASYRLGG